MSEPASWTLGLFLIALTIVIHTAAVVMMAFASARVRVGVEKQDLRPSREILIMIGHVGAVGLALALLHGLEAVLWAAGYVRVGAIGSFGDAVLYSIATMTTRGTPSVALPYQWQMMGALEALNGILLFGVSTAFIFAMLQMYWSILSPRH